MLTTAMTLIQSACEEIGQYDAANVITDADAERCLQVLNDMMDSWSNENLSMFAFSTQSFPLIIGKTRYSIGPSELVNGGTDIDAPRPLRIEQCYMTDEMNNNYPIDIVWQREWNEITNKEINGQVPTTLFYDPQDPIGFLNFWPTPILVWTISIVSYLQLTEFTNLTTPVVMPRGYVPALKSNLAVAIAPFFGMTAPPTTIELASRYLGNLKRKNYQAQPATYDSSIVSRGQGSYDIFSDSYAGGRGSFSP